MRPLVLGPADPLGSLYRMLVAEGAMSTPGELGARRKVTREAAIDAMKRGGGITVGNLMTWVEACGYTLELTARKKER